MNQLGHCRFSRSLFFRLKQISVLTLIWSLIGLTAIQPAALAAGPGAVLGSETTPLQKRLQITQRQIDPLTSELFETLKPPFIDALEKATEAPELNLRFSANDPVLDADPFFLRAQSWKMARLATGAFNPAEAHPELSFTSDGKTLRLSIQNAGVEAEWTLKSELRPVLKTREYVFLAPQSAEFFGAKGAGEGIFFIPITELLLALPAKAPTPIYFLPLPDGKWHAPAAAFELDALDAAVIQDGRGIPLPILYRDLEQVILAERNNLVLAGAYALEALAERARNGQLDASERVRLSGAMARYFSALRASENDPEAQLDARQVFSSIAALQTALGILPAPGSTAGFGTLLLDQTAAADFAASQESILRKLERSLNGLFPGALQLASGLLPSASASDSKDPLTPEQLRILEEQNALLWERVTRVSVILSAGLIASVALRYTKYHQHFETRRIAQGFDPGKLNPVQRMRLSGREILDVYAHTLTSIHQIPTISFGHALEFGLDRFLPSRTASESSWIRTILNRTVFFATHASSKVPVNANTWFKGAVVLGGIDTAFVGMQLYEVVPYMSRQISQVMPALDSRVNSAFEPGNPLIDEMNRNEVIRNGFAYASAGAMSFSQDVRTRIMQVVESEVEKGLTREGYDLNAPGTKAIKEQRMEKLARDHMKRLGLPGPEEFLFDYPTMIESAYRLLGYRRAEGEGSDTELLGEKRPGLVLSSLRKAITAVRRDLRPDPSREDLQSALALLEKAERDASLLRGFLPELLKGIPSRERISQSLAAVRRVRQSLLVLTYEGPAEPEATQLPTPWMENFGEPGSRHAAQAFREAFFGYLKSEDTTEESLPQGSFFARRQKRKAAALADEAFLREFGIGFDTDTGPERRVFWREQYVESLMRVVGLYPDYSHNSTLESLVKTQALATAEGKTQGAAFQAALSKLSFRDAAIAEAHEYAESEIAEYLKQTVWNEERSRLEPSQPGIFQKLRQTSFFRKDALSSRLATRMLRAPEALMAEAEYSVGLSSAVFRRVPGAFDVWHGIVRSIRFAPTRLSVAFLYNWMFWGADISWMNWAYISLFITVTISAPSQGVSRFFEHQNWKPLNSIVLMAGMATIYSWLTFWGSVPGYIFAGDFQAHFWQIIGAEAAAIGSVLGFKEWKKRRVAKASSANEETYNAPSRLGACIAGAKSCLKRCGDLLLRKSSDSSSTNDSSH